MEERSSSSHPQPIRGGGAIRVTPRLVIGIAVLLIGLLLALDNLGIVEADVFLDFWPLIFVGIGVAKLADVQRTGAWLTSTLWIALGLWWIAYNLEWTDIDVFELFWPVILMIGGWFLIRRAISPRPAAASAGGGDAVAGSGPDTTSGFALWTGVKRRVSSQTFTGGDFTAIMGGCDVDLSRARIEGGEAILDVFAFWGGIEIKVPPTWLVQPEVTAILGGVHDRSDPSAAVPGQRLIVRGLAMMGGIDIRTVPGPAPVPPPPTDA